MLFINGAVVNADGSIAQKPGAPGLVARSAVAQMTNQQMTHFNLWDIPGARALATWNNNLLWVGALVSGWADQALVQFKEIRPQVQAAVQVGVVVSLSQER